MFHDVLPCFTPFYFISILLPLLRIVLLYLFWWNSRDPKRKCSLYALWIMKFRCICICNNQKQQTKQRRFNLHAAMSCRNARRSCIIETCAEDKVKQLWINPSRPLKESAIFILRKTLIPNFAFQHLPPNSDTIDDLRKSRGLHCIYRSMPAGVALYTRFQARSKDQEI